MPSPTQPRPGILRGTLSASFVALYALASLAGALTADRAPRAAALPLKALPVTLLLALAVTRLSGGGTRLSILVAAGLALSLLGDLGIELHFLLGLGAFLLAHLAYLAALGPPGGLALPYLPAALLWAGMLLVLWRRVPRHHRGAVVVYAFAVTSVFGRALERAVLAPGDRAALLLAAGATLFAASDALLAVDRWVRRLPASQLLILGTYDAGQALIEAGAVAQ
jgi:uncharacterized membrane protein YhhN